MRHSFNSLLVVLVVADSSFLLFILFEKLVKNFYEHGHTLLFAHFIYPMFSITLNISIYMVVAIAVERYRALYHPQTDEVYPCYIWSHV